MAIKNFKELKHWYEFNERKISVGSLAVGFIIDSLTLQSIDNPIDQLWITANLLNVALCILLLNSKKEREEGFWLPNILQFSFGALLGSIFVFYLRSTTLSVTWPFLGLVLFAILANEFFQKRYSRLAVRLSFFYFALFSYTIFLIPILLNRIGPWIFLLSGLASLAGIWVYLKAFNRFAKESLLAEKTHVWTIVIVIFASINLLYFTNLIPPIPLSMKDGGVYHAIEKDTRGRFLATGEKRGPEKYFTLFPVVYWKAGEPLYAYSAVFAPGSLETEIVHDWQYKNMEGKWVSATQITLPLEGGRSAGFRTFSKKFTFSPGLWRVDIKTTRNQIIGRVNFKIVPDEGTHPFVTEIKE